MNKNEIRLIELSLKCAKLLIEIMEFDAKITNKNIREIRAKREKIHALKRQIKEINLEIEILLKSIKEPKLQ